MTAFRLAAFGVLGLCFGSFATVLMARVPARESPVSGRSRCPSCGATIGARDNVPVVSYVVLGGRCRACRARISPRYPLTELASGALFVAAAFAFSDVFVAGVLAMFLGLLLALAVIDLEHRILPNAIVYPSAGVFAAAVVAGALTGRPLHPLGAVAGLLLFGGFLFLVAVLSPGGMGMGDVKLAGLIGLVLGALGLRYVGVAIALAVLAGGLGAVGALVAGRSRKSAIPFGPYLAAGAAVAAFWATPIAGAYLSLR